MGVALAARPGKRLAEKLDTGRKPVIRSSIRSLRA
jgi:hypothetical protein